MQSRKALVLVVLLACGSAAAAAAAQHRSLLQIAPSAAPAAASTTCPIDPSKQSLDFSKVSTSCAAKGSICTACVCALVGAFGPALTAGGVAYNAASPESFPLAKAAGIVRSCAEEYLVAMMMANVNVSALAELNNCNFASSTDVPTCLATEVSLINTATVRAAAGNATGPANTTAAANATANNVTAASRNPDTADDLTKVTLPEGTASAAALRIATVQATPSGPVFTLAGQLDSAGQLLKAMAASQDLLAAMTPEAVTQLNTLVADASNIDANPRTSAVLAGLENPINGVELLSTMAQLNVEAPVAPAGTAVANVASTTAGTSTAAGASAPAPAAPAVPKSSAGAHSVAAMATAGAVLLAALLL